MTFTYAPFDNDSDRVRFHIADTVEASAIFSDEEINALISEEGGWQAAVIACLESLIAQTAQPGFTADWLKVDNAAANAAYRALLREKQRRFGHARITASAVHTYRADSNQLETPDYTAQAAQNDDEASELW